MFANDAGAAAGTDAVRGQLRFNDGNWDVNLKAEYGRQKRVHSYYEQIPSVRNATTGLAYANPNGTDNAGYNEKNFGAGAPDVVYTNDPQRLDSKATTILLRAEHKMGDVTFTSVSGYMHYARNMSEDCDASPNPICTGTYPYSSSTATQELRLYYNPGALKLTAGLYGLYAKAKNHPEAVFNIPVSGPTAVSPTTGLYNGAFFPIDLSADWRLRTTSVAAFAQAEYLVAPSFTLIVGGHITQDNKHFDDKDNASLRSCPGFAIPTNCFPAPAGPGIARPYSGRYAKTLYSGKIEADYQATPDILLFGSVSRGSKGGGFNNGFYPGGVSPTQIPYKDEYVYAYEAGEKATFLDRTVRLNTSLFYYDYRNFQTFNFVGIGGLLANQKGQSYGIESEIEIAPVRGLTARVGGLYLKTKLYGVTNGTPSGGTYTADREMSSAPRWTANGEVSYTTRVGDGDRLSLNWNWDYRSSRFTNNFNDPSVLLPGYFKHNASVTYGFRKNLELQAFVRNIGNIIPVIKAFQFNDLGYTQLIYSEPRVFGGAVTVKW